MTLMPWYGDAVPNETDHGHSVAADAHRAASVPDGWRKNLRPSTSVTSWQLFSTSCFEELLLTPRRQLQLTRSIEKLFSCDYSMNSDSSLASLHFWS